MNAIAEALEERCQCGFTSNNITDGGFWCFSETNNHVTFRGRLLENPEVSSTELKRYLEDWIKTVHSLLIQGVYLGVNTTCSLVITDLHEPECPQSLSEAILAITETKNTKPFTDHTIWAVAMAVTLLLFSTVTAVLIAVIASLRRKLLDLQGTK